MKETKKFFDNNKLNRGYGKVSVHKPIDTTSRTQYNHVLPPVDVMAEYEEMSPGSIDKILDMAQKEQNHRHSVELLIIEKHNRAAKAGRCSALALVSIIAIVAIILTFSGHHMVAAVFSVAAFGTIGVASFIYSTKIPANKNFRNHSDSKHKNPNYKPRNNGKY